MAKKKNRRNQGTPIGDRPRTSGSPAKRGVAEKEPGESQAVAGLTVFWLMTVLMVSICDLGAAAARLYYNANPDALRIGLLSGMAFFAAAVMGLIALVLTPIVLKVRGDSPPPRGIVAFALLVSIAPIIVAILQMAGMWAVN